MHANTFELLVYSLVFAGQAENLHIRMISVYVFQLRSSSPLNGQLRRLFGAAALTIECVERLDRLAEETS